MEHLRRVLERNGYQWRQCIRVASATTRSRPSVAERNPAYLPYIRGITDKIGHLLRRRYSIRTIFRPPGQLRQMLRSPKDRDPLGVPGVYSIPCDCGLSYVGETRRNVATRLREHIRSIKNVDSNRSAVAEHACNTDTAHYLRFDKATVLAREKYFVPRKVREAIEISRRPNFNRDSGWRLSPAWKPSLKLSSQHAPNLECDTISTVCTIVPSDVTQQDTDTSDDDSTHPSDPSVPTSSTRAPTPPPSARAMRHAARWQRAPQ